MASASRACRCTATWAPVLPGWCSGTRTWPRQRSNAASSCSLLLARFKQRVPEAVLGAQPRDAVQLDLDSVTVGELCHLLRVEVRRGHPRRHLVKAVLESSGGDDLEDPAGAIACVPERMPLLARLEDKVARVRIYDIVSQQGAHPALQHVAVLVLAGVFVQRRHERSRRDRMLDER